MTSNNETSIELAGRLHAHRNEAYAIEQYSFFLVGPFILLTHNSSCHLNIRIIIDISFD